MLIFHYFSRYLMMVLPYSILLTSFSLNEIAILSRVSFITQLLSFLKLHTQSQFTYLSDLCGVDFPQNKKRFEVVYNLLSVNYNQRIRVRVPLEELETIPSIVPIFTASNWWEREVWDMFGIYFHNHPNLRRILTDYGFIGHPLRKDFPLIGFIQVRYDDNLKRIAADFVQKRAL